jgi:phosphoribosyl-ATP pyrophosphohydrolase/phosphoribosyl-AMP cyclohydrolase/histidinol dehydrogenase
MRKYLRVISPANLPSRFRDPADGKAMAAARTILKEIEAKGESAVRKYAEHFGDIAKGAPLAAGKKELEKAYAGLKKDERALLRRVKQRIESFARAQKNSLKEITLSIPGGRVGHQISPVQYAGCYAPGGRFPLPSSVLMTAVTARVAGVKSVWVASPKPEPITLAAAFIADADGLLKIGGIQAIGAFAFGTSFNPACDVIAGPGNKYVTAAKKLVSGRVLIDMLAGPSELTILADDTANPRIIAADLLAQAEHDTDAVPILVTADKALIDTVDIELGRQLKTLKTAATAARALENGFAVAVKDIEQGIAVCDALAPEHLELCVRNAEAVAKRCANYGGLFIGQGSAEVLGDYGAGPNHTLPTGGTARYTGGLSVFDFLRVRTWLKINDARAASGIMKDSVKLAELEGLIGHARAAACRQPGSL